MRNRKEVLLEKLERLKAQRNALIIAHNYQVPEVLDVADYVGDSFELSQKAADLPGKDVIVFCGVLFMAEVASILSPEKTVLLPDYTAGCSLADMITGDELRAWKEQYPAAAVVSYVNSSAEVKALSDVCVTSANAVAVVDALPQEEVLFVPDRNLAHFVACNTEKHIIPWDGYCESHDCVKPESVAAARRAYPDAVIMVHPECTPGVVSAADQVCSTGGMLRFARETEHREIVVGTEIGMLYRLRKENPEKSFYALSGDMLCPTMKLMNLEKIVDCLESMQPQVSVPENIAVPARKALERMLATVS